jgi:hypothetical protein
MPRSIPKETKRGPGHVVAPRFYNVLKVIVLAAGDESRLS